MQTARPNSDQSKRGVDVRRRCSRTQTSARTSSSPSSTPASPRSTAASTTAGWAQVPTELLQPQARRRAVLLQRVRGDVRADEQERRGAVAARHRRPRHAHGVHRWATRSRRPRWSTRAAGMAPKARLAGYKVCWPRGGGGSFNSDILAAFDAAVAVADRVEVVSLSVGGVVVPYHLDAMAIGAFGAIEAGIVVSASVSHRRCQVHGPRVPRQSLPRQRANTRRCQRVQRRRVVVHGRRYHVPRRLARPGHGAREDRGVRPWRELVCRQGQRGPPCGRRRMVSSLTATSYRRPRAHQGLLAQQLYHWAGTSSFLPFFC
jgi:hypothetical protein